MKRSAVLVCALFVAGMALGVTSLLAGDNTHELSATVMSVDVKGSSITFKDSEGAEKTAPVIGEAVKTLDSWKAGDMVVLTCTDDENGKHEGISGIRMAGEEEEEE